MTSLWAERRGVFPASFLPLGRPQMKMSFWTEAAQKETVKLCLSDSLSSLQILLGHFSETVGSWRHPIAFKHQPSLVIWRSPLILMVLMADSV